MSFAVELTELLPAFLGGTASLVLTILEMLLLAIVLMIVLLWVIQKITTRNDPPNNPFDF